ncbi:response regulator [Bradyrhizobium sp. ARR65]|uniref:response regulator n=1 Tax=Bradyrhizobium sp. ARR65 TaxID=1040989 RepID=UPI00046718DC|nr:response regulator [Bradyrhizobium sp. ARR65]
MPSSIRAPLVYVIDDDADVLRSLRFLLEADGFEVRTFRSGEALLNGLAIGSADCFVIDYRMPHMTGVELASALRKRKIGAPIILITGSPNRKLLTDAAAAGISHILPKPHIGESLLTHVRAAIDAERPPSA